MRLEVGKFLRFEAPFLVRVTAGAALIAGLVGLSGCGATYRPVINSINPVGPSSQPQKYAVAISSPCSPESTSPTSPCSTGGLANATAGLGIVNIVDFSGDTLLATPNILADPAYFAIAPGGGTGYVLHRNGQIDAFSISNLLQTRSVFQATLPAGAIDPSSAKTPTIFAGNSFIYTTETGAGAQKIAVMTAAAPPALQQEFNILNPVYTVGRGGSARVYTLGQGATPGTSQGTALAIDTANSTVSNTITVGVQPVYGVMNADARRAFVLNKGDGTVSVINTQTNALDSSAALPSGTITVGANPIWADVATSINELAIVNAGDGVTNGSLSILYIPLCNAITVTGNATCDPNNPVDAVGFGTSLTANPVPVGVNPVMVAVLQDAKKAYVANAGDGTVSVIDMTTFTKVATIDLNATLAATGVNFADLNYIAATGGTPTGKVYVTAAHSQKMAIISTNTDTVTTSIPLQGYGISVLVTQP